MWLIVGLGNPGPQYQDQRHNVGFMIVDALAHRYGQEPFKAKFQGLVAPGSIDSQRVLFLKPQNFMNRSGQSVRAAMDFYKIQTDHVIIFHDDLDLSPVAIKLKRNGGHGGHNGLRDIIAHLGPDFWRVRIGIGHPGDKTRVHAYVLSDFSKTERAETEDLINHIVDHADALLADAAQGTATLTTKLALKRN